MDMLSTDKPAYGAMSAYYRCADKKLHKIDTKAYFCDLELVRQEVHKTLHESQEVFYEPILILIKGGKG